MPLESGSDLRRRISDAHRNADKEQVGRANDAFYERIPRLAVGALMASIVQLEAYERLNRVWVTEQKVYVLAVNTIGESPVVPRVTGFGIEQVAEGHLKANKSAVADGRSQHQVETLHSA